MEQIPFDKTLKILQKYKIPFAKSRLCKNAEQAKKEAKSIGFPVALKIVSSKVIHKSDVGGVKIGLNNEGEVQEAFEQIIKKTKNIVKKNLEGVLVQKMYSGTEVVMGLKTDAQFGAVLMFGLGGIFVEIIKDVSFRIAPVDKKEAESMIEDIKGIKILEGARGKRPANKEAIVNIIIKLSKLAENKKIKEIDFNPVIVNEKGAVVVDARIIAEK